MPLKYSQVLGSIGKYNQFPDQTIENHHFDLHELFKNGIIL